MKIDFNNIRDLANELTKMNGSKTNVLAMSQKTYDENVDNFTNDCWENLKIEIVENGSDDNIWLYNKDIGMRPLENRCVIKSNFHVKDKNDTKYFNIC
jgi:hypothetical protein